MLEAGTEAPDFELPDQNGELHKLSEYLGKKVILYFYPRDNTPDAQSRLAVSRKDIRRSVKKELLCLG